MLKSLSPIFCRDRGTSKSLLFLADRRADREGMSVVVTDIGLPLRVADK